MLVAVTVLAVGITMALGSFDTSITAVKAIKEYLDSAGIIEDRMFQIRTAGIDNVKQDDLCKINSVLMEDLPVYKVDLSTKRFSVQTYIKKPVSP